MVSDTDTVPAIDDPDITYPNFEEKEQKCKRIETCILYIDIRKSTELNVYHRPKTLAKLYSAFVRVMAKSAGYFSGKVRNIIGDRVMVVFDKEKCFTNAVNTAVLLNSVAKYLLDKNFPNNEVKCGIGIDYGKMLVAKTGIVKRGSENLSNKGLVWLGRPANIASKLTDLANKSTTTTRPIVCEGFFYPSIGEFHWQHTELIDFVNKLETTNSRMLRHKDKFFDTFFESTKTTINTTPPILITDTVYEGFKRHNPDAPSIKNNWWTLQSELSVPGHSGNVYGGDIWYTDIKGG